jgi:hypothetical protein
MRLNNLTRACEVFSVLLSGRSHTLEAFNGVRERWGVCWRTIRRDLDTWVNASGSGVVVHRVEGILYWRWTGMKPTPADYRKKRCSACRELKVAKDNFGYNRNSADGYHNYCHVCRAQACRDYRANNKERINKQDRMRYQRRRTKLLAYMKRRYQQEKQSGL